MFFNVKKTLFPVRNNFSKRRRFDIENKSRKFSEISIDFDGCLAPISINFWIGNKILNWSSQHKKYTTNVTNAISKFDK